MAETLCNLVKSADGTSEYKEYANMSNCNYFHMYRYGKVRVVVMALPTSVSAGTYTIGTVDANDYPIAEAMFDCPTYIGIVVRFHIDANGVVKMYISGASSAMNGVINAVYIAK